MRRAIRVLLVAASLMAMLPPGAAAAGAEGVTAAPGAYRNFAVAIYIPVSVTRRLAEPQALGREFERISSEVHFDRVYLETYRGGQFADEASLARIKAFFASRGIAVSGGITLAKGGHGGQFGTFDYESPPDRAECRRAVEMAARNFDEVILDDFFFYTSKSDADIAAKGGRSWTEYRLAKMRAVTQELVLGPARAANPRVKMIIKYPNWYEHFQALGYDLDLEAKRFDYIYTGTETRDPVLTDQLLQQYESYLIFRYLDNIRPGGGDRGGWVDTFSTRYVDRYAEQLWDTLFAKAPEITLFNWAALAAPEPVAPGDRAAWSAERTSFDWDAMLHSGAGSAGSGPPAGWARVAGYSLAQVDRVLDRLGRPIGIASYKPYQSDGEDFLHDYLGNIGLPIELLPEFPRTAGTVLLTESAKADVAIVAKIRRHLRAGGDVVITSGLLQALRGRGIEDIAEIEPTGRRIAVHEYFAGYGAGDGARLDGPAGERHDILWPEIRFHTNDSWALVRGVAEAHGVPILLMNRYSRGILYVLAIPDNVGDLYDVPQPVTNVIRSYLQADFPVRIDAPARVSLFAYDNGAFVVESFRAEPITVRVSVAHPGLRDLVTGEAPVAEERGGDAPNGSRGAAAPDREARTTYSVAVAPHSYRAFATR